MKTIFIVLAIALIGIGVLAQEANRQNSNASTQSQLTEADRLEGVAAKSFSKRDYKEAIELLSNALSLREKALGPNHPDVAATLHNLANVYEKAGKHEQSRPLYLRAISIQKDAIARSDPESLDLVRDYRCAGRNSSKDDNIKPDAETGALITRAICSLVGFGDDCDMGNVLNGEASKLVTPPYPRGANVTQIINVYVRVDEAGKVISAKSLCGDPLLRQASVEAAFQAKFKPRLVNGKPTQLHGVLIYNFVGR